MTQTQSKHKDPAKYHYIWEWVTEGAIQLPDVPTTNMSADIFTKSLGPSQFVKLRRALGIVCVARDRG